MKFTLMRETLLKPLQMVIGVVDRKQTLPILTNVLLNVNHHQLSVIGTDLEIELIGHSNMDEPLSTPFKLTLPGRKLLDICRTLPEGSTIEIYQDKQQVLLRSQRSRFTLSTLPVESYPASEEQIMNLKINVSQAELLHLIQRTHFAMAQQDVRHYLNGMLFEFSHNTLRTIATDGHRLAANSMQVKIDEEHRLQAIVPRKGVLELMRLLSNSDQDVTLAIGNNCIQVTASHYTFLSKLVEGRFPDYQRVIPKRSEQQILINREQLKQALIRSSILCNDKIRGVFFELKPNLLRLLANNNEQELAEEELSIDYSGPEFGLAFNINYLLDVLNTLHTSEVQLIFSGTNNSLLIEEPNLNKDSVFVIMPMRI